MPIVREFVPFGEWTPDQGKLGNGGLYKAHGIVPVHGDYIAHPTSTEIGVTGTTARGLMVSSYNTHGYVLIDNGANSDLKEVTDAGVVTNRTRTGAGNYNGTVNYLGGCSFGDSVICTLFDTSTPASTEPVQYLAAGAARFANMITSTFEPRAKHAFSFRNNLFLANCYNPVAFDTLAVTTHYPRLVAWSQSDNIRQFGSFNVTPQLIGCGYQELNFDLGDIVDAVACSEYAIVAMQGGLVRIDGPPYSFRVVARGFGCVAANAITAVGSDIYYVSHSGLLRLRGGDGEPETLGLGKWARWLTDTSTFVTDDTHLPIEVSGPMSLCYDSTNGLIALRYLPANSVYPAILWYSILEDRATIVHLNELAGATSVNHVRVRPSANTNGWVPGRDFRFLRGAAESGYGRFIGGNSGLGISMWKGFIQPVKDATTKIRRIRPVYRYVIDSVQSSISVVISTYADPNGAPSNTGALSSFDKHGWIVAPGSSFGDWHEIKFAIAANSFIDNVVELEGFDIEFETGGAYSA